MMINWGFVLKFQQKPDFFFLVYTCIELRAHVSTKNWWVGFNWHRRFKKKLWFFLTFRKNEIVYIITKKSSLIILYSFGVSSPSEIVWMRLKNVNLSFDFVDSFSNKMFKNCNIICRDVFLWFDIYEVMKKLLTLKNIENKTQYK